MTRPETARITLAAGYTISRIVNGGWQLARDHGREPVDPRAAVDDLLRLVDAGLTTFDCADIYGGVEELLGRLLREVRRRGGPEVQVHTKFVPDLGTLPHLARRDVERSVDRSLARLGVERLDLVQLHWWDYGVPGYVEAARWLDEMRQAGKIRCLGATNFDLPRLTEILDAGVELAVHQVQYSLLDRRPENGMVELCRRRGLPLLAYGALAGGFLSGRYLGRAEPAPPLANRSLVKYRLILDEFGGWELFQELLMTLRQVADKHGVPVAAVAARWALDRPQVAGVILGTRDARHRAETLAVFDLELDAPDLDLLAAVLARSRGPAGDVYALERTAGSRHAAILRTDLNRPMGSGDPP